MTYQLKDHRTHVAKVHAGRDAEVERLKNLRRDSDEALDHSLARRFKDAPRARQLLDAVRSGRTRIADLPLPANNRRDLAARTGGDPVLLAAMISLTHRTLLGPEQPAPAVSGHIPNPGLPVAHRLLELGALDQDLAAAERRLELTRPLNDLTQAPAEELAGQARYLEQRLLRQSEAVALSAQAEARAKARHFSAAFADPRQAMERFQTLASADLNVVTDVERAVGPVDGVDLMRLASEKGYDVSPQVHATMALVQAPEAFGPLRGREVLGLADGTRRAAFSHLQALAEPQVVVAAHALDREQELTAEAARHAGELSCAAQLDLGDSRARTQDFERERD